VDGSILLTAGDRIVPGDINEAVGVDGGKHVFDLSDAHDSLDITFSLMPRGQGGAAIA
jgi:hypothetical protein